MRKKFRFRPLINLIVVFLFVIASSITLAGCFDMGGGSGGGSSSGGSSDPGVDISSPQLQSDDPDDFFSGALLMYDAGYSGEFYDDATETNVTFYDLADRQISTFVTHLLYALNVIYGSDNDGNLASTSDRTQDLMQLNDDLANLWQGLGMIGVKPSTLLTSNVTNTNNLLLNTSDYDNTKNDIANSISIIANLGNDWLGVRNQFSLDNAIKGGYKYVADTTKTDYHAGAFDKSSGNLNTSMAWSYDISASYTNDAIKQAVANILANNKYESGASLDRPYEDCLKEIDFLGFSPNNLTDITNYILEVVIGNAYAQDETIRATFAPTPISIVTTRGDEDLFFANINQHYYRGYQFVVRLVTERIADISIGGLYASDEAYAIAEAKSKLMTYPIMPRTIVEATKLSEIFSKTNDIGIDEDGNIKWGDGFDFNDPNFGLKDDEYKPVLENVKLKNIVLMPKLSDKIKKNYDEALQEQYGANYTNYADYRFKITSISLGVNGTSDMEVDEFILNPYFNIYCSGQEVHSGVVTNESKSTNENLPDNATFWDEYSLSIDYVYSVSNDVASYTVGYSMGDNKFSDYSGVKIYDDSGKVNKELFAENSSNNYLILSKGAKAVNDDAMVNDYDTIFNAYIKDGDFNFVFNGGADFLQIDFRYFDKNATDIYNNSASKYIEPQICDLVYFSIWT